MDNVLDLAPAFTLEQARQAGVRKDQVYALLEAGMIERMGRGVYLRSGAVDPQFANLVSVSTVRPEATGCLTSALIFHDLSDAIPFGSDIALPRGVRQPAGFEFIEWHTFAGDTFELGREFHQVAEQTKVAIYSAERTIVDCFRLAHHEGTEVAYAALRRWLRMPKSKPASLLRVADAFPQASGRIQHSLEVLL